MRKSNTGIILVCVVCTIIPDVDVLLFQFGVEYSHPLGHRGFSHSILFALLFGAFISYFYTLNKKKSLRQKTGLALLFSLCTLSHGLLDAMTSGGLGVGFFIPFENSRYFFPFRPIKVSPIGIEGFFSKWGLRVLKSEAIWIGIPCIVLIAGRLLLEKAIQKARN